MSAPATCQQLTEANADKATLNRAQDPVTCRPRARRRARHQLQAALRVSCKQHNSKQRVAPLTTDEPPQLNRATRRAAAAAALLCCVVLCTAVDRAAGGPVRV